MIQPLLCLTLLASQLTACAPSPPRPLSWDTQPVGAARVTSAGEPLSPRERRARYEELVSDWTRTGECFEDMEGRLFVSATLLSPTFERARAAELSVRQSLTAAERRREEEGLTRRAQEQRLFFVALATQEHTHNDLRPRGSVFSAHLIVGEEAIPPSWIIEATVQEQLALRFEFPFLSSLHRGYWVSFPAVPLSGLTRLRVAGIPGAVTLSWDLGGPESSHLESRAPQGRKEAS